MAGNILILADPRDRTADRVAAELAFRGVPFVRLDAADFPGRVALAARISTGNPWTGTLTASGDGCESLDLSRVTAVYYRHPTQFVLDERMSGPEKVFAYREARRGFGGVLLALGLDPVRCRWVNDQAAVSRCEYKPVQLAAASALGMAIPRTLITSDAQAAYAWAGELRVPVVYKPLGGVWHADEGQVRILYTTPVDDPCDLLDPALSLTAHLFQEKIPKAFEARAIVVGSRVFAVRIDAHSEPSREDWRSDYDALVYGVIELPAETAAALVELHRRLGLVFGAVDLICDTVGRWVFLETNSGGEWGWLAAETGIPVAEALADELMRKAP